MKKLLKLPGTAAEKMEDKLKAEYALLYTRRLMHERRSLARAPKGGLKAGIAVD